MENRTGEAKKKDEQSQVETYMQGLSEQELMVMKIAEDEGMVKDVVAELSTPFYGEVFEFFFNYNDKQKEMLFNFKLFIFEKKFVKDSKDTDTKAEMRNAQSPIEVMNAVMKLK